jgi:hypothetical protein
MKKQRKNFMRIAMARLAKDYPFKPQRMALAANMYRRWLERNNTKAK